MKIGFLLVTILVVGIVYRLQTNPPLLADWSGDLPGALREANVRRQRVLLLFVHDPLSENERWVAANTLSKNDGRIREGGFLRVKVTVPADLDSNVARAYGVRDPNTPALLMLGPDGRELRRLSGRIGEMPLAEFLLDPNRK